MIRAAAALLLPTTAWAGACDRLIERGTSQEGAALVSAFEGVLSCDRDEAAAAFPAFMRESGDAETLAALSLAAIDAEQYAPVWAIMDAVRDFSQRQAIVQGIGSACAEHDNVVPFLQGAYFGLRGLQFVPWAKAIEACGSDELRAWSTEIVAAPPSSSYDEKYAAVAEAYVALAHVESIDVLKTAAIAAADAGPFDAILGFLDKAIEPQGFGTRPDPAHQERLADALVAIGEAVSPDKAILVGDRLHAMEQSERAATLLAHAYPGTGSGGQFVHGAASVEACDGEAVVHYTVVTEPGTRWSITDAVESGLHAFRPRLRCEAPTPWPTFTTPGPVASEDAVQDWARALAEQQEGEGKIRKESPTVL